MTSILLVNQLHKAFQQFLHDRGVSSAGLTITVHPHAIAGIT